jgi:NOL1/NOP2/fmu family ribosome biogenesis protein
VAGSAARQAKILAAAARLVKPGGLLLYSTCTFAVEENEGQIDRFLDAHPDWELVEIPARHGLAAGRADWAGSDRPLERTARLWPHLLRGEGHFLALLRKPETDALDPPSEVEVLRWVTRASSPERSAPLASISAWQAWCHEALADAPAWLREGIETGDRLREQGGTLFLAVDGLAIPDGLRVVRPGLPLGAAKPGRFVPSHALALALPAAAVRQEIDLAVDAAERFLTGETLAHPGAAGWVLLTVAGFPLGWGRRSGGIVKNHYPRGLRRPTRNRGT